MRKYLISSLILTAICISIFAIPQATALPVSYNQTALNFGLTSVARNSSSYDVFTLNQDNWLWEKFDNNTIDSGLLSIAGTVTYNTNLKALWKFENVLTDSSSNGFTLTKVAGTNNYASGQEGNAFSEDGSTYYTASSSSLPTGTNDRSVSFWLLTPSTFISGDYVFAQGAQTNNNLFAATWASTAGTSKLLFQGFNNDVTSNTTFQPNTWYYITLTLGSSGTVRTIYVNGVQDIQSTTTALNTSSTSLFVASGVNGAGQILQSGAKLDEFRTYNVALSLAQHKALYMVGKYSQSHTFDGGEYVSLGNNFKFTNTTPFTISLWVNKPSSASAGNELISKGGDGTGGYEIYYAGTTVYYRLWDGGGTHQITATATNDVYHYIAATWDGSSNFTGMKLYIDGVLQSQGTSSALGGFDVSTSLCIGISCGDFANALQGQEDNVKIYPYALSSSQITSDYNSISPISSGKQYMSWYNGIVGSSTLTQKIGSTKSTLSLSCNLPTPLPYLVSNTTNIYYVCANSNIIHQINIQSGTDTTYFKIAIPTNGYNSGSNSYVLFKTIQNIVAFMADPSGAAARSATKSVNNTLTPTASSFSPVSNQKLGMSGYEIKYNTNSSTLSNSGFTTNPCEINYTPTTTEKSLDNVACDIGLNPSAIKYWNGFNIQGSANYATNSTQTFLNSIDASSYKKLLSLPCLILVNENPCITFIATDFTNTDYLVVLTSTHVYYGNAQTALHLLQNNNYALQSYDIITPLTTSAYEIQNPILQGITLYGFNLNTTVNKAGLFTLPSGYTTKTTTINSAIRTIDPRWTNDATDIPIITTTQSLFPIYLTASNAPSFAAIKVTQPTQILNGQESVYAVAQLDSTRSVEFDLVAGTCANIYIADISVSPTVWNFEGIICATGVNQKTVAYTNTVPFTFYTLKYGVTDSYVPSNNGLQTTFRTQASPTTYTVIVRNSTGTVAINQTFTVPANQTVDTRTFNVSSVSKPASLAVTVGGNMVYSSYLGSALSLATVSSFFHQYFSYQGFDLVAFIPVIFASAFTRNTVGAGMVLVVLMIATLSWLSVTVVPEPVVYVSAFIAVLGLIGYRSVYG